MIRGHKVKVEYIRSFIAYILLLPICGGISQLVYSIWDHTVTTIWVPIMKKTIKLIYCYTPTDIHFDQLEYCCTGCREFIFQWMLPKHVRSPRTEWYCYTPTDIPHFGFFSSDHWTILSWLSETLLKSVIMKNHLCKKALRGRFPRKLPRRSSNFLGYFLEKKEHLASGNKILNSDFLYRKPLHMKFPRKWADVLGSFIRNLPLRAFLIFENRWDKKVTLNCCSV